MKIINCFVIILGISETLALKVALIRGTNDWETLMGGGRPCPVAFDPDDVRETMKLDAEQGEADEIRRRALRRGHGTQQEAEGGCIGGALALGRHGRRGIHVMN